MADWYVAVNNDYEMRDDIARGRYEQCGTCGATVAYSNRTQHANFHLTFSNRKDDTMSGVAWCDPGNHAFKNGEPGSLHFDGDVVNDNGLRVNQTMDACAEHNPMRVRAEVIAKELLAEYPVTQ